ncbi:MAG: hypothetical protein LYZ69_02965 [Nitrososphaerales archaeon]|nr:hypothetical protein [Nitrososphaerales archaeon]
MSRLIGPSKRWLGSLLSSMKRTIWELAAAVKLRSAKRLIALVSEGSPLESSIEGVLGLAFRVIILAPVILMPAYYLILTLVRP